MNKIAIDEFAFRHPNFTWTYLGFNLLFGCILDDPLSNQLRKNFHCKFFLALYHPQDILDEILHVFGVIDYRKIIRNDSSSWIGKTGGHPKCKSFDCIFICRCLYRYFTLRKKCWNNVDFPHTLKFLYFPHRIQVENPSHNLMWLVLIVLMRFFHM